MDTNAGTTPTLEVSEDKQCWRCREKYVPETMYLAYIAAIQKTPTSKPLPERLMDAPAAIFTICGDCFNEALGGKMFKPSVRLAEEIPGTIRLRIREDAPANLIPQGYRPGDTVGHPTGETR